MDEICAFRKQSRKKGRGMRENPEKTERFIDLHTHTVASDGTLSSGELLRLAGEQSLAALAISDHDTMDAFSDLPKASSAGSLRLIPGVEMSAVYLDREVHILGYLFHKDGFRADAVDESILSDLEEFARERRERNLEIIRRLRADGIDINEDDLYFGNPKTRITRAHFARFLVERSYVRDMPSAFKTYLKTNGKYCPPKTSSCARIMGFFRRHDFFPSLAHPLEYRFSNRELENLLLDLKSEGLKGIEAYHSTHRPSDTKKLLSYAKRFDLLPTGGSDFHGDNKPDIRIGIGYGGLRVPLLLLEEIDRLVSKNGSPH